MKRFLSILLVLALAFAMTACSSSSNDTASSDAPAVEETTEEVAEEAAEEVTEEATEEAEEVAEEATEEAEEVAEEATEEAEEVVEEAAEEAAEPVEVMSYADYMAAELDSAVCVETYVQAKQSWWDNKATVYSQDEDGAYFLYSMACSEEDYEKLVPGTKIRVNGFKSEWSGEVEIVDATFEIIDGEYVAEPVDVTDLMGKDELAEKMNQFVSFKGVTVAAYNDEGAAFSYAWDGSGDHDSNSDLYFNVEKDGVTYTFTVESYLCNNETDVYAAVEALNVGDVVDIDGFMYWYEGAQTHVTNVVVK